MDTFANLGEVEWARHMFGDGRWEVFVPSWMDNECLETWELPRFFSMESYLEPGMLFYEVGAHTGSCDVPISRFVGGAENMVLIEPNPLNWPNTKATLERNGCGVPRYTFQGFVGMNETADAQIYANAYPQGPDYSKLITVCSFRILDEQAFVENTPCLKLDTLVKPCGAPDAINIDVEGAAMVVLQSGEETLKKHHPLLWVSVHPSDLRLTTKLLPPESDVHDYLTKLGYKGTFLGKDHEDHWFYV
jgi:FkbM family methyltransferase